MNTSDYDEGALRRTDGGVLWHPFTQMQEYALEDPPPPLIAGAEGNWLIDIHGRRYLDANSGYWCLALGCRPLEVEAAVGAQLARFAHSTLLGISHVPAIELARRLAGLAGPPYEHVFFADSGSEAVEAALKIALQYWQHRGQPQRCEFLGLGEAYHGDTLGAVAVGGVELFHAAFEPLLFDVHRVPPPHCYRCPWDRRPESCALECAQALERAIGAAGPRLAAVVIEPFVQGPGGIIPQPAGYVERAVAAARRAGALVIFDEVAVGVGRLGTLFAFEQLSARSLRPELVCLAKGLTAGVLPLSAVLATGEVFDAFLGTAAERKTFYHGHTFTGSALGCAAALAALKILGSDAFLNVLREKTIPAFWEMLEGLRAHPRVGSLRGRGMMAGIEVVRERGAGGEFSFEERAGQRVVLAARERGVNVRTIGNVVLAVPPLTITQEEIGILGRVLRESLDALSGLAEARGGRSAEGGGACEAP